MIEIERKFLVLSNDFMNEYTSVSIIKQGYLNSNPKRTVRIRVKNDKGYITIKGMGNDTGLSRYEWEKEISLMEANELLLICESGIIEKKRYNVKKGVHTIEIDVFEGENNGLIIAEIELKHEKEYYEKPVWLGAEVTGNERYYNAYLNKNPYKKW